MSKGIYEIERQFGKGAHLYWLRVTGGVKGHRTGAPGEEETLAVGVILQAENILRTITGVVDAATMRRLDTAICGGELALPAQGAILDSSHLLVQAGGAQGAAPGVR